MRRGTALILVAGIVLTGTGAACSDKSSGGTDGKTTETPTAASTARPTAAATGTLAPEASDFSGSFDSVAFVDSQTGWVSGYLKASERGVIMATTDGGRTWQQQYSTSSPIGDVQFVTPLVGWATVFASGGRDIVPSILLHTTDGGGHWQAVYKITGSVIVDFITPALGRAFFDGALMETRDAGTTWSPIASGTGFRSVCFSDANLGWGLAGGDVLRTSDGGRTWSTSLSQPTDPDLVNGARKLWCKGPDVAWTELAGPADPGHRHAVYRTVDAGAHWAPVMAYGYPQLGVAEGARDGESVHIIAALTVAVLGDSGGSTEYLQITRDAGGSWGPQLEIPHLHRGHLFFVDADHGWAVGRTDSSLASKAVILATSDGGRSWTKQFP